MQILGWCLLYEFDVSVEIYIVCAGSASCKLKSVMILEIQFHKILANVIAKRIGIQGCKTLTQNFYANKNEVISKQN